MNKMRATVSASAAGAVLAAGTTLFGPVGAAHASPSDCEGGANGFVGIPDSLSGEVRARQPLSDTNSPTAYQVTVEVGTIGGVRRGWARIGSGDPVNNPVRKHAKVWTDWRAPQSPIQPWLQCGPFEVRHDGLTATSAAKRTDPSPDWQFRACGSMELPGSPVYCTDWW
ncbi:hypothetical protein [Streptomyces sp. NBC_01750]|uniref:hypothetical protein n=1 Tax=Streptomyces sp. NBC_01750 TaxID=2975928 RepID=UPI002DDB023B|nr:hypothetical protein [Streptomyces sp. NBC_01750]WSD36969.1 hypothetical protein OG966_36750 [Streptomyces sp. NBC_01750]